MNRYCMLRLDVQINEASCCSAINRQVCRILPSSATIISASSFLILFDSDKIAMMMTTAFEKRFAVQVIGVKEDSFTHL